MPFFNVPSRGGGSGIVGGRGRSIKTFLTRQVITRGYLFGGYQNSTPWTNVNYIQHSTDSAVDLGNLASSAGGYCGSSHNADRHFIWNTGGMGAYTTASSYNMRTNTNTGDFTMPQSYDDSEGAQNSDINTGVGTTAWIFGGSSVRTKFNLSTASFAGTSGSAIAGNAGHHFGENVAYIWTSAGQNIRFTFATESEATSGAPSAHDQQKGHSSKIGFGWAGNEGSYNGGNIFRKWSYTTENTVSTPGKPITNSGEENLDMGQAHAYMLGMFDGAQNNRAWRWNYSTDSGFEGSSTMQPRGSGIGGRSSGACAWRDGA